MEYTVLVSRKSQIRDICVWAMITWLWRYAQGSNYGNPLEKPPAKDYNTQRQTRTTILFQTLALGWVLIRNFTLGIKAPKRRESGAGDCLRLPVAYWLGALVFTAKKVGTKYSKPVY